MHVVDLAFLIVGSALFVGAVLQGCIGFGMIVLSFPVLVSIEPALLPQSVLIASVPTVVTNAAINWGHAEYREVGWLMLGRIPGLIVGVALVRFVDRSWLAVAGGLVVLVAVALSLWAPQLPRTVGNLFGAGSISALFGTSIGIGGPPLGLLYQHESGQRLRSTISLVMLTGGPVSLALLATAGEVSATDLRTGLALIPFTVAGTLIAPRFTPWFDERVRVIVLGICAFTAIIAVGRVLLTL